MNIIERGVPIEERAWYGKCENCDSVIEAMYDELRHNRFDGKLKLGACPVCVTHEVVEFKPDVIRNPRWI